MRKVTGRVVVRACLLAVMALYCGGCALVTGSAFSDADRIKPGIRAATAAAQEPAHDAVSDRRLVEVPAPPKPDIDPVYTIGPGDVLHVSVNGDETLGSPSGTSGGRPIGSRVDGDGYIQLPLVGRARVGGLSLRAARLHLREHYGKQLRDPSVVVEVLEFGSQPIYLVGAMRDPGVVYLDRPTTVVQGLALGGGLELEASLRGATVHRDGRMLPVDLYRLLVEGDVSQNIYLRGNDTVFVPDGQDQVVFVLGSVPTPAVVPMYNGRLTLTQALASAEGLERAGSTLSHIRVIRSLSPTRGELLIVDYLKITRGEALPFPLRAGDVVFVPRNKFGSWNDTLAEITPSLEVVRDLLQPFVQISVLTDD